MKYILLLLMISMFNNKVVIGNDLPGRTQVVTYQKRINFFISSKTRKINPAMQSAQLQAHINSLLKRGFVFLIVDSAEELKAKILPILTRHHAMIGSIWFDSHGHFSRRYSSFEMGATEFSYAQIKDGSAAKALSFLVDFCDSLTTVGIGSCSGGASFTLPAIDEFKEQKMNGDSLTIGLGEILNGATVYSSESFVISRPGMFSNKYALAGFPLAKKFLDPIYSTVWKNVGRWNLYSKSRGYIKSVGTIYLDRKGNIHCQPVEYLASKSVQNKLGKKLKKLRNGNYNLAYFYKASPSENQP
jgi:hypothetical protein